MKNFLHLLGAIILTNTAFAQAPLAEESTRVPVTTRERWFHRAAAPHPH